MEKRRRKEERKARRGSRLPLNRESSWQIPRQRVRRNLGGNRKEAGKCEEHPNSAACVHFTLEMIYILLDGIGDLKMPGCCSHSVRPCVQLAGILLPTDSSQYHLSLPRSRLSLMPSLHASLWSEVANVPLPEATVSNPAIRNSRSKPLQLSPTFNWINCRVKPNFWVYRFKLNFLHQLPSDIIP